jgi:Protein of unknown function (DUF3300)
MQKVGAKLRLFGLVPFFLFVCSATLAQQPPDNVAGDWIIYSTNVEDGRVVVKHVQIVQSGSQITGHFDGPEQSGAIEGEVHGHRIRFSTVTRNVLHFGGDIFGDTITGSYGIRGRRASWEAIRTTASSQDYPTGTVLSGMPMLTPTPPPAPVPPPPSAAAPAPAPASQPEAPPATTAQVGSAPAPAPQTPEQLQVLVAPIALYPDALVAQVLAAASYPEQISFADYWVSQNKNLTGDALTQAADQEPWDPSVKALTQFPTVLHTLASNLTWTSNLGEAFHNQEAEVMAAIQVMRAKAQAAGTLLSTPQVQVVQQAPNTIVIQPVNPQVVYVPQYNPAVVYGVPYVVPFYTAPVLGGAVVGTGITFGAGVSLFGGVGLGWGWHAWGCNWGGGGGGGTVVFNNNTYINRTTNIHNWHGANYDNYHPWGPNGGGTPVPNGDHPYNPHGYYGPSGYYHPSAGWHPGQDTHYGPGGAYHANGYYGPDGGWHPNSQIPTKDMPNGGDNGNHGLIGGKNSVQNPNAGKNGPGVAPAGGYHNDTRGGGPEGGQQRLAPSSSHSSWSGDGGRAHAESDRGRESMHDSEKAPASHPHTSHPQKSEVQK